LQALEKPLGLPPGLVSHAEEIRQQDGLNRIYRSVEDTAKLKASDRAIYTEGVELLNSEATEDERARLKYGTDRWPRTSSKDAAGSLYAQVGEIDTYLKSAGNSDELVMAKIRECERFLKILAGTNRDIEEFVPSSRRSTVAQKIEREVSKLRASLNDISRLESRRRRKIEALKTKAKSDDISMCILNPPWDHMFD
jgi:programmed cell death 6-interacting protein